MVTGASDRFSQIHLWPRVPSWQKGEQDPQPQPLGANPEETEEVTNKTKAMGKIPPPFSRPGISLEQEGVVLTIFDLRRSKVKVII